MTAPKTNHFLPNSFQTPNLVVDKLLALLKGDEVKIVLFTIRHVYGWPNVPECEAVPLSLSTFENGHRGSDGVGLSRPAIKDTLDELVTYRVLRQVGEPTPKGQLWGFARDSNDIDWDGLAARRAADLEKGRKRTRKATRTSQQKRQAAAAESGAAGTSDVPDNQVPAGTSHVPENGTPDVPPDGTSHVHNETQDSKHTETHKKDSDAGASAGEPPDDPVSDPPTDDDEPESERDLIFDTIAQYGFGLALFDKAAITAEAQKIGWIASWAKGNAVKIHAHDKGRGLPGCYPPATVQELKAFYNDWAGRRDKNGQPLGHITNPKAMAGNFGRWRNQQREANQPTRSSGPTRHRRDGGIPQPEHDLTPEERAAKMAEARRLATGR